MKNSYSLLGVFWDGIKTDEMSDIKVYESTDCIENNKHITFIDLSDLLKINTKEDYLSLINHYANSESIAIKTDYVPKTDNIVVKSFYKKRLGQMISCLKNDFNNVVVVKTQET